MSGAVQISAPSRQGQDAIFNLIPSGEIFGEIALLDGGARTADALVIEDGDLMLIERRDFMPLVRDNPELAMKLVEIVCARLRKTTEQVEDLMFMACPRDSPRRSCSSANERRQVLTPSCASLSATLAKPSGYRARA